MSIKTNMENGSSIEIKEGDLWNSISSAIGGNNATLPIPTDLDLNGGKLINDTKNSISKAFFGGFFGKFFRVKIEKSEEVSNLLSNTKEKDPRIVKFIENMQSYLERNNSSLKEFEDNIEGEKQYKKFIQGLINMIEYYDQDIIKSGTGVLECLNRIQGEIETKKEVDLASSRKIFNQIQNYVRKNAKNINIKKELIISDGDIEDICVGNISDSITQPPKGLLLYCMGIINDENIGEIFDQSDLNFGKNGEKDDSVRESNLSTLKFLKSFFK